MYPLLVALSLLATSPIGNRNNSPAESAAVRNDGRFHPGFLVLHDRAAMYGSDLDGTLTIMGTEAGRNEFKQVMRMIDVPKRLIKLEMSIHSLTGKDGKVQDDVVFKPSVSTYNNEETSILFRAAEDSYLLKVVPRVNNDGTITVLTRYPQRSVRGLVNSSR